MKFTSRFLLIFGFMLSSLFGGLISTLIRPSQVQAAPLASFSPQLSVTSLSIPNASQLVATSVWTKIGDVGHITLQSSGSMVEITHQGMLIMQGCTSGFTCGAFQIRVDNVGPIIKSGTALFETPETAVSVHQTFSGYWQNLAAGDHIVSIWAEGLSTNKPTAIINPGGMGNGNQVIVKEYLPFGFTYLPQIQN